MEKRERIGKEENEAFQRVSTWEKSGLLEKKKGSGDSEEKKSHIMGFLVFFFSKKEGCLREKERGRRHGFEIKKERARERENK